MSARKLAAFAAIYLIWGSTFLAIRIGVREVPPFLLAAMRFFAAGALLAAWSRWRGDAAPALKEWRSAFLLAVLVFLLNYGLVFWAEQRVPSGVTAVMMATIPAFTALSEILILKTQRLTLRLGVGLGIGLLGVAALTSRSLALGGQPVDRVGAVALVTGALAWGIASALTRILPLPSSKSMSSAAQMLAGCVLLGLVSLIAGEWRGFDIGAVSWGAWAALFYMVVPGSIIAFTAYIWLIHHESPTRVGTYAYVNPVIAVILGYFLAHEALDARTALGTALVLASVVTIVTMRREPRQAARRV